jgi:catechol 2,3-dioxygenase-like lactoylglutathione lyase family enzyme
MAIDVRGVCPLLQVYDMPTSVRFYRDKLGFEVATTSKPLGGDDRFHWCTLRLGDADVMLNTAYESDEERPVPEDGARREAHGDTCLYFGCPDVDAVCAELRAKGVPVDAPKVAWYGMKQLYLLDPDGYNLCFQWAAEN